MNRQPRSSRTDVLAVASEAGSGKALAPVLQALCERGVRVRAFLPQGLLDFIGWVWPGTAVDESTTGLHSQSIEEVLSGAAPAIILVGTTARESLERELILHGRRHEIPTLTVVDERYGFQRRFGLDQGRLDYLPDVVTVMDEECAKDAVGAGVPAERICVTGSPLLSFLAHHHRTLRKRARAPVYHVPSGKRLVAFISETFARDNGSSPGQQGLLGSFLGFTEETVRKDLLTALRETNRPAVLLERLHPSDDSEPKGNPVDEAVLWRQIRGGELWPLLAQSDVVIGMRSMALLEAALLGCRVASYQPNLIGENLCGAVRFGVATKLDTLEALKDWLLESLSAESCRVSPPIDLPFIRPDAAERVADLVLGVPGDR